jgi:hypothetical protein
MYQDSLKDAVLTPQEKEKNKHKDAILRLAKELGAPPDEVKRLYEESLELFKNATIKDYVPIFVGRDVKERLKLSRMEK